MAKTFQEIQDLVSKGSATASKPDAFGVSFYESKEHDIHHYFKSDGTRIAGTTSAIGEFLPINGLEAKYNIESRAIIDSFTLNSAAEKGTRVHGVLESYIKAGGKASGDEFWKAHGSLKSAEERDQWNNIQHFFEKDKRGMKYDLAKSQAEISLSSEKYGYAGTIDIKAWNKVSNEWEVIDLKTGEIPKGGALQTAGNAQTIRENDPSISYNLKRNILQPSKKAGMGAEKFLEEANDTTGYFKTQAEDLASLVSHLTDYKAHGLSYPPVDIEIAKEAARASIAEKLHPTTPYYMKRQYIGLKNINAPDEEETKYIDFWKARAEEMGVEMEGFADATVSSKQGGRNFGFSVKSKMTDAQTKEYQRSTKIFQALKKKEERPLLSGIKEEWDQLKNIHVGDTLRTAGEIGERMGADILSTLTHSSNIKAAAIGGAIGYAGGLAYGALHDTSDPTSTYQEERHLLGNAIKGSLIAGTVSFTAAAMVNKQVASSATTEMVSHIGNKARGMGGKITGAIMGAWKMGGGKRI